MIVKITMNYVYHYIQGIQIGGAIFLEKNWGIQIGGANFLEKVSLRRAHHIKVGIL